MLFKLKIIKIILIFFLLCYNIVVVIPESSNGRTGDSGSPYGGSNPSSGVFYCGVFVDINDINNIKKFLEANLPNAILSITANSTKIPGVNIDRSKFLKRELKKYYPDEVIAKAIEANPHEAGIPIKIINKIADNCIKYERYKTTTAAAVLGAPGVVSLAAFAGIVLGDITQYYAFLLRLMQKLLYLYGFPEIRNVEDEVDDETKYKLLKFMGIMIGGNDVANGVTAITKNALEKGVKKILKQPLTKTTNWYPILRNMANKLGQDITKKSLEKAANKAIPVVGAIINGSITYALFKQQANSLKNYLIGYYGKGFMLTDDLL